MGNKFIVYQTTNLKNNRIFIGIHKTSEPYKFDGYIGDGVNVKDNSTYMYPKTPFQFAVKKYGVKSFRRSILHVFSNIELAYKRLKEIVTEDFINQSDNYNCFIPKFKLKKIYQFDKDGNLIKEWDSIFDIIEFPVQYLINAIEQKYYYKGSYWSYENSINNYSKINFSRKVYKYNKDGKCLAMYNTIQIAAKENNTTIDYIEQKLKLGMFSTDYYYSIELFDTYVQKPRLSLKNKILYLYNKDNEFVEKINIKDFQRKYDIRSYKKIANIIKNKYLYKNVYVKL